MPFRAIYPELCTGLLMEETELLWHGLFLPLCQRGIEGGQSVQFRKISPSPSLEKRGIAQ
jgi:hypothetical protein